MSRFVLGFVANNAADLVLSINTALAALVDPTINRLEFNVERQDGQIGDLYSAVLRYTDGGAVLATPMQVRMDEAQALASAVAALQAFLTANPLHFVGPTLEEMVDGEQFLSRFSLLTLFNVTAGASANYIPV